MKQITQPRTHTHTHTHTFYKLEKILVCKFSLNYLSYLGKTLLFKF